MTANMTPAEVRDNYIAEKVGFRPTTLLIMYSPSVVLALLGLLGNVVSMVVWTRPKVKSSSAVLLTALAASDLLILISANTMNYTIILWFNYYDSPAIDYMYKFIRPYLTVWLLPVNFAAETASIYLTLTITLERYIAVCRPFQARLVCTYRRACWYAATVITISILYNLTEFMRLKIVARFDANGDIKSYRTDYTELARAPLFQSIHKIYATWLLLIMVYLLPFICIAVLNTLIYIELRRAEKRRQTLTVSLRKENRLTWMLVYVVAEFLVCSSVQLLYLTVNILNLSKEQLGFNSFTLRPLDAFFQTFNSSSNFLTYVVCGRGFREELLSTFSCCRGLRSLRRSNGTDDREVDVRRPEIPKCQSSAGNEMTGLQV